MNPKYQKTSPHSAQSKNVEKCAKLNIKVVGLGTKSDLRMSGYKSLIRPRKSEQARLVKLMRKGSQMQCLLSVKLRKDIKVWIFSNFYIALLWA